jgi:hypothetical protein
VFGRQLGKKRLFMKTPFAHAQPLALAVALEYGALPSGSSERNSLTRKEAGPGSRKAGNLCSGLRGVGAFFQISLGFVPLSEAVLDAKVAIVFTPAGPLLYRWKTSYGTDPATGRRC